MRLTTVIDVDGDVLLRILEGLAKIIEKFLLQKA
jgi:hypothetical protein